MKAFMYNVRILCQSANTYLQKYPLKHFTPSDDASENSQKAVAGCCSSVHELRGSYRWMQITVCGVLTILLMTIWTDITRSQKKLWIWPPSASFYIAIS